MMAISKSMRKLSETMLGEEVILASWGISNVILNENTMTFTVSGFKYTGPVEIVSQGDNSYQVALGNIVIGTFTCDTIVEALDRAIERTEDYPNTLRGWLSKVIH